VVYLHDVFLGYSLASRHHHNRPTDTATGSLSTHD